MKILFVIRSLENGGAERQLSVLANELGRRGHTVAVAVFHRGGVHDASLDPKLVRLIDLDKRTGLTGFGFLSRLLRIIKTMQPDVIHGYLSAGNLAATVARRVAPRAQLIWGIRDSLMEFSNYSRTTQLVYAAASKASRFADVMIFNSIAGLNYWKQRGWVRGASYAIPNGIDAEKFTPDRAAGRRMRADWGVPPEGVLIGMAGRYDPMKGHETFLRAAQLVTRRIEDAWFVAAGGGSADYLTGLQLLASQLGIADRVLWPGPIGAMRAFYNALDVFCLSSRHGEGFPNVLGEAMACGCQCVTTDVGDARWIAGDVARVVTPDNPEALATALCETIEHPLKSAAQIRTRVFQNFTVTALADRTEEAFGVRRVSDALITERSVFAN